MKDNEETFGEMSDGDVQEQLPALRHVGRLRLAGRMTAGL